MSLDAEKFVYDLMDDDDKHSFEMIKKLVASYRVKEKEQNNEMMVIIKESIKGYLKRLGYQDRLKADDIVGEHSDLLDVEYLTFVELEGLALMKELKE